MRKTGHLLDKFIAYLGYSGAAVGVVSIVIMTLLITANVLLRYLFNAPLKFGEEYSAYLFIVACYMGLAYTMRKEAHIRVELLIKRLPSRAREGLEIATSLASLLVIAILLWASWKLSLDTRRASLTATTPMATPLWIPQSLLWLGLAFFWLEVAARTVKKFIALQKGAQEGANVRTASE